MSNDEAFVPKNEVLYDYTKKRYIHVNSGSVVEIYEEENFLFSLGKFKKQLESVMHKEIQVTKKFKSQINAELKALPAELSVSRPANRIPWGILIPNEDQTVYVWVDALINYYTALGYPERDPNTTSEFSNMIHILGKDILRFHSILWPALLLANEYPIPKHLVIHNFWLYKKVSIYKV